MRGAGLTISFLRQVQNYTWLLLNWWYTILYIKHSILTPQESGQNFSVAWQG